LRSLYRCEDSAGWLVRGGVRSLLPVYLRAVRYRARAPKVRKCRSGQQKRQEMRDVVRMLARDLQKSPCFKGKNACEAFSIAPMRGIMPD
jgi:hypothetical protein